MLSATVLVAASAACGGSGALDGSKTREAGADAPVVSIPSSEVDTPIVGGSPEQHAALREILAGIGPTSIERIEIEAFGDDEIAISFSIAGGRKNLRGEWEAWLVAGIFRDASDTSGLPAVLVVDTNGDAVRLGRRVPAEPPPPPDATPEATQALAATIQEAAAESESELVEFSTFEPAGLAFAITLETDNPAALLKARLDPYLERLDDRFRRYEGTYFRLVDEAGETVWQLATTSRMTRAAHGVTRPELRGCDPIPSFPTAHVARHHPARPSAGERARRAASIVQVPAAQPSVQLEGAD
jgi:hypothetical protein